jgi:hypothetical protein
MFTESSPEGTLAKVLLRVLCESCRRSATAALVGNAVWHSRKATTLHDHAALCRSVLCVTSKKCQPENLNVTPNRACNL